MVLIGLVLLVVGLVGLILYLDQKEGSMDEEKREGTEEKKAAHAPREFTKRADEFRAQADEGRKREEEEKKGRPSNEDLYNKEPEIDPAAQPAVDVVLSQHAGAKGLEGKVRADGTGYDVTAGSVDQDGVTYHIWECDVNMALVITETEERRDTKPEKPEKP